MANNFSKLDAAQILKATYDPVTKTMKQSSPGGSLPRAEDARAQSPPGSYPLLPHPQHPTRKHNITH